MRAALWATILLAGPAPADPTSPVLPQRPAVSATEVAFHSAGDLWVVPRAGGDARRLTAGVGLESYPVFSPDGRTVAFAGEYEGNLDVYTVPAAGGIPRRLTHHPDPDAPVGWTPDGASVLFRSGRTSHARFQKLFTVPAAGGQPTELPLPMAEAGSFSPDGKRIAYVPLSNMPPYPGSYRPVRNYRGGTAAPLWIADLADSSVVKVPRTDSNDFNPMWVGDSVYFLSDRDGPTSLYATDGKGEKVRRLIDPSGTGIKSASACADAVVFERFGSLHLFDLKTEKVSPVPVRVAADLPAVRPRVEKVAKAVTHAGLSPAGTRAVFEARGEVLTVPAEKGEVRNLTNTPGAAERSPVFSPDGKTVAFFSDESGEYELHLRPADGRGPARKLKLSDTPSFFYNPVWSPDGKKLAYADKRLSLWYVDLDSGKSTRVDTSPYATGPLLAAWSPDSNWLAYSRPLKSQLGAVFLFSLADGKPHQVTDGMSDAQDPVFDKGGRHLFFTASTDAGPAVGSGMSTYNRPVTRAVYVAVLSKADPSPLAPEADDDKPKADADKKDDKKGPPAVTVDLADLDQRTLALPLPARDYTDLLAGKAGSLLLVEAPPAALTDEPRAGPPPRTVHRFDLLKRKAEKLADGVAAVAVSADGDKLLYRQGDDWFVAGTGGPVKPGDGKLNLDALEVRVDPPAEWRQMYKEAYRVERDFLYDPHFHGYDLKAAWAGHERYLPAVASRADLSYLLDELLGGLSLQHVYIQGGDYPKAEDRKGGLLGADFTADNGRHRVARVYRGESWNPSLRAPLTQPGAGVKEGEYLLAVNGVELRAGDEVYKPFEGTANRPTVLRVGPNPDGKDAREVVVVPVASERALRNLQWVDTNRRKVDELTGGKVGYVYVPNTSTEGYVRFNRYFFAQAGRDGVVVDERFNGGGSLADHVIDYLRQPVRSYASTREGADEQFPPSAVPGPKVMLINEQAGSGGDYLPYTFRQAKLGPLVGKRTWGGLVGIGGYPPLVDGGTVTAPRWGLWFPTGRWEVENRGVAPDVEVEHDPKLVRQGRDPQLEKAVAIVLDELKKNPVRRPARPPYPDYYKPGLKEPGEGR